MPEPTAYYVADEIAATWLGDYAAGGITELEALLEVHADFRAYLEDTDQL